MGFVTHSNVWNSKTLSNIVRLSFTLTPHEMHQRDFQRLTNLWFYLSTLDGIHKSVKKC